MTPAASAASAASVTSLPSVTSVTSNSSDACLSAVHSSLNIDDHGVYFSCRRSDSRSDSRGPHETSTSMPLSSPRDSSNRTAPSGVSTAIRTSPLLAHTPNVISDARNSPRSRCIAPAAPACARHPIALPGLTTSDQPAEFVNSIVVTTPRESETVHSSPCILTFDADASTNTSASDPDSTR